MADIATIQQTSRVRQLEIERILLDRTFDPSATPKMVIGRTRHIRGISLPARSHPRRNTHVRAGCIYANDGARGEGPSCQDSEKVVSGR